MQDEDLRDLFAGLSMIGLIQHFGGEMFHPQETKRAALWAYDFADALIAVKRGDTTIPPSITPDGTGIAAAKPRRTKKEA